MKILNEPTQYLPELAKGYSWVVSLATHESGINLTIREKKIESYSHFGVVYDFQDVRTEFVPIPGSWGVRLLLNEVMERARDLRNAWYPWNPDAEKLFLEEIKPKLIAPEDSPLLSRYEIPPIPEEDD